MSDTDIHSCGYYCDRHACIEVQRNELRDKMFEEIRTSERSIQILDSKEAESARSWVGLTDEEILAAGLSAGFKAGSVRFNLIVQSIEAKLKEKNT